MPYFGTIEMAIILQFRERAFFVGHIL